MHWRTKCDHRCGAKICLCYGIILFLNHFELFTNYYLYYIIQIQGPIVPIFIIKDHLPRIKIIFQGYLCWQTSITLNTLHEEMIQAFYVLVQQIHRSQIFHDIQNAAIPILFIAYLIQDHSL